jgi:hypothetical protein
MKMNMGKESIGYQLKSLTAALKLMSAPPPCPHSSRPQSEPTNPMTPKTRCPVSISIIIEENINRMISVGAMV